MARPEHLTYVQPDAPHILCLYTYTYATHLTAVGVSERAYYFAKSIRNVGPKEELRLFKESAANIFVEQVGEKVIHVPAACRHVLARPSSSLIKPAPGSRPIVAYAHSVFATFCALNVPASASARPSSCGTRDWSLGL